MSDHKVKLSTLTQVQADMLGQAKQKAVGLAQMAMEAEQAYHALLTMAMPPGANCFDAETMSFCYDPEGPVTPPSASESDEPVGKVSGPAIVTDDS